MNNEYTQAAADQKGYGISIIYDALDNLSKPVENGWTRHVDELEAEIVKMNKLVDDLELLVKLAGQLSRSHGLYEEALEVACEEVEKILDGADYSCSLCFIDEDSMPIGDCDNDCGVCLKTYFLKRGQENIDMEKAFHDEVEGRKRMDAEDIQKESKGTL